LVKDSGVAKTSAKAFTRYGYLFRKMIWPETNGVSPVTGKDKITDFFKKAK
jgi:hypothetical protein